MHYRKPTLGLITLALWLPKLGQAAETRFTSPNLEVELAQKAPGLAWLDIDGLGRGRRRPNSVVDPAAVSGKVVLTTSKFDDSIRGDYRMAEAAADAPPLWTIEVRGGELHFVSNWNPGRAPEPLTLFLHTGRCPGVTLLGRMNPDGAVRLPALLNLPNQGSLRITSPHDSATTVGYTAVPRRQKPTGMGDLTVSFPGARADRPHVEYRLEVCAIYPNPPGIADDVRFDDFRRNWLNVLQLNPGNRMLSNNSRSTSCAFCYYEYADIAAKTPPLAQGLDALDLVRDTLDAIIGGATAYGLPAEGNFPGEASDSLPSLLIAADDCVEAGGSDSWLMANYEQLRHWAEKMLATDTSGDGLIKYRISGNSGIWPDGTPKVRPSNWWDTIGFGHEDAYANALAYRALGSIERMARRAGKEADATRYRAAAEKLRAAYFKTFYNPSTGVLGGWRSADGVLHDYYFLWVNGIAITYGLVPKDQANAIMDRLMAKMKQVGYTQFHMGLPGNLITVPLKDYVHKTPDGHVGGGVREDNADGFQKYENGGATASFAYFTLAALYGLGRSAEADRILFPMLGEYGSGGFSGRGPNGRSNDWRMWDGTPTGYEGYLCDNYYALLAVVARQQLAR